MIFNSRVPKKIEIDDVEITVNVLTASQQAHIMDLIDNIKSNVDLVKAGHEAMNYALVDITGLKDESGKYIKPVRGEDGKLVKEFLDGFSVTDIRIIVTAVLKAGRIPEEVKKN